MRQDEKRNIRKKFGLCVQCAAELDRVGSYCTKCNTANNKNRNVIIHKLHEEKKCSTCAKPLDREGWFCSSCAKDLKLRARERNLERRSKGLCVQCASAAEDGRSYCKRCLDMRMQRYWKSKNKLK